MKQSPDSMKKQELMNDPQEQRQSFTGSISSSDKTKDEKGMAQSIIHPGKDDCYRYFRTGTCGRSSCKFNHHTQLPQEFRERAYVPVCKYFLSGHCKKGSGCDLLHPMNRDGAEPMHQIGTESSGFKRPRIIMNPSVNAQENLQEQRQENIKRQRREAQETLQQQRLMREMPEIQNVEAHNNRICKNLQEDQRRRNGKRSRSIEGTKGRNLDLRLSKSGWRSDERHEIDSRSRAGKKDKEGQIRDYRDSSNTDTRENQQQQRDRSPDLRRRYDETASDWGESISEWRYDKRTGRRYERLQSGGYIVHPGKNDCFSYFQTGTCLFGRSSCKFNHPTTLPKELPKTTSNVPVCKARSMYRRASESEWEFDELIERRYETDSGYSPEKRSRTIPDSRSRDPRGTFEDTRQTRPEIEPEYEQERREIPENHFMAVQRARERREARDNMQEQRAGGRIIDLSQLINPIAEAILRERMRNIEIDRMSREESPMRYEVMDRDGLEPMRQSTSQRGSDSRQGFEASGFKRPRIPVNPRVNAQVNLQEQKLVREMPENHNVEDHNQQNPQEQSREVRPVRDLIRCNPLLYLTNRVEQES